MIAAASASFGEFTLTVRTPNPDIKIIAQTGVSQVLIDWVVQGSSFVASRFSYPKISRQFVNVIAVDATWLAETYTKEGFSPREVQDRVNAFNAGAPAFGGSTTNTWNWTTIERENLMTRNRSGMAQTPGHEFFHTIQENFAKNSPGPRGESIPNWFWEGPSMFIGFQTSKVLGHVPYATSREEMTSRFKNSQPRNRTLLLEEVKANNTSEDPYAIGFAATEFLVANVGVEKLVKVYAAMGIGNSFSNAFKEGTGVELAEFYLMFEQVRSMLGFPKG